MIVKITWNAFYGDKYGLFAPNQKIDARHFQIVECPNDYLLADVYDDFVATFEEANERKAVRRENGFSIDNMEIYNIMIKTLN